MKKANRAATDSEASNCSSQVLLSKGNICINKVRENFLKHLERYVMNHTNLEEKKKSLRYLRNGFAIIASAANDISQLI